MRVFRSIVKKLIRCGQEDHINVYAAQVSFFMIISAIPMVILIVPLIQYVLPSREDFITNILSAIVPEASGLRTFVLEIFDDVYTNQTGTIVSVSAIAALWSASKGIYALQEGLNNLADIKVRGNPILRRGKAILYTIAFIVVILFSAIFIIFGNAIRNLILSFFPGLPFVSLIITLFRSIIAFELFVHFFIVVYSKLPSSKTTFSSVIPNAMFTAIGWMLFSYIFAFYVNNIAINSYIYGSLTSLVLLMLWLYFCMLIFFAGAELPKIFIVKSENMHFSFKLAPDVIRDAEGTDNHHEEGGMNDD